MWNGGLVFYGGFIAATAACILYLRKHRMPFLPVADASSLGIMLGLAFGRLGCTSAGCCFGKPSTLPWAITFTDPACLAPLHVPLHPTQIYESIGSFAIFGFLYATRDRFKTPGVRFWTMLILYGAARSFFEIFRDDPRGFVGPFSESQVVSAALIAYAVVSILRARAKAATPQGAAAKGLAASSLPAGGCPAPSRFAIFVRLHRSGVPVLPRVIPALRASSGTAPSNSSNSAIRVPDADQLCTGRANSRSGGAAAAPRRAQRAQRSGVPPASHEAEHALRAGDARRPAVYGRAPPTTIRIAWLP